jgi:WD40 repeat protein
MSRSRYAGSHNAIQIWDSRDVESPVMLQEFVGHREPVHQVLPLSGGRIVSAGNDPAVNVYDIDTLARVAMLDYGGAVNDLAITPDEHLLFAAGTEREIKGYDLGLLERGGDPPGSSGVAPSVVLQGHCARVFAIDVSSDGQLLASAAQDFDVMVWKLPPGGGSMGGAGLVDAQPMCIGPATRLEAHSSAASSLAFNHGPVGADHLLATGGTDHKVIVWSISTTARSGGGKKVWECENAHEHVVSSLVWGRQNTADLLFSGAWDHTIKVWKVSAGHGQPLRTLQGHRHRIEDMVVTRDGESLLSASWDSSVRLWDIRGAIECTCEYTRENYRACNHTDAHASSVRI